MSKLIDESRFVICDVETTGLNPVHNRVIEIALIKVENFKIVDKFTTLINPETFIPPFITELTGIHNEDVFNAPKFSDVICNIQNFLKDSVFVAHNASFDYKFLLHSFLRENYLFPTVQILCTKLLAKRILPGLQSYGLGSLIKFLRIKNLHPHRAYGDALATTHLLLKLIEEGRQKFLIDDLDTLLSLQFQPIKYLTTKKIKKDISEQIAKLPIKPGVYIFKNSKGEITYIGKAKNLRNRVLSYFRNDIDSRVKKIVRSAHYLEFIETGSELSALLLEAELINKHKPKHNTALKIIRKYSFIALQNDHPYPRLEITSKIEFDETSYFGPFQRYEVAEKIMDVISKSTLLRECDDKTFSKKRPCYLLDIKRCLGPCINTEINGDYQKEIETVKSFLTGDNLSILNRLIEKMKEYSSREKFEEAAEVRDAIQTIVNNLGRIKVLKEPINSLNSIIIIYDEMIPVDFISIRNGILLFTKKFETTENFLHMLTEEYFISSIENIDINVNITKIKIIANFLVNKKSIYKIIYTTGLSREEVFLKLKQSLME